MTQSTLVETPKAEESPADKKTILIIFACVMIAMLLAALDQTIFGTALPTIVGELNGVKHMLWVATAYILASTITMPIYGKFGDLVGRKNLFIFAISIFIAGSVVGGLADSMEWLIAGRAIQGLGGGGLMILAQAIIADVVPARERGKYMGMIGGVFGLASVLGPILGGWFTEGIGWRWAFWINIPLGLVALAISVVFLKVPRHAGPRPKADWAGIMVMAVTVTALILFTSWGGNEYAWDSATILGLIALTVVGAALFVFVESRASEPIIPLELFRDRNFNLATVGGLAIGIAMFGALAYLPTYLQMVNGLNATNSGFLLLPLVAGIIATSTTSGALASKTGRYKWMPIAGSAILAVSLLLLSGLKVDTPLWQTSVYLFIMGAGIGFGIQILVLIVQNAFPQSMVGTATAANNFFREIGASLGAALVGSLFSSRLTELLTERLPVEAAQQGVTEDGLVPSVVNKLPEIIKDPIIASYNDALTPVFLMLVPLMLFSMVLLTFIKENPLKTSLEPGAH